MRSKLINFICNIIVKNEFESGEYTNYADNIHIEWDTVVDVEEKYFGISKIEIQTADPIFCGGELDIELVPENLSKSEMNVLRSSLDEVFDEKINYKITKDGQ